VNRGGGGGRRREKKKAEDMRRRQRITSELFAAFLSGQEDSIRWVEHLRQLECNFPLQVDGFCL